jgi:nucleoside-diphosphate-sugar epimerase
MSRKADILLIGGSGRIGAALARGLGSRARVVVRRPAGHTDEILTSDYAALPPGAFAGIERVINCVGISTGAPDLLERINVDIPVQLAVAAREGGVRHFIHISSFSVYGGAVRIDRATRPAPTSDYGRTKLVADEALAALSWRGFDVALLRLPLVYAPDALGKLGQLLGMWRHIRILPVPSGDVCRAMIGVELTAEVVARLVALPPSSGVMFAADPRPFTYRETAHVRHEALRQLHVSRSVVRIARRVAPALGDRLFSDSRLDDADNLAVRFGLSSRLYRDIAVAML